MVTKEYGKYKLICDNCGEASEEEFKSFYEALKERRKLGWTTDNHSTDICPECSKEDN